MIILKNHGQREQRSNKKKNDDHMSILIKNAAILTQNKKREQLQGDIYIEDKEIIEISKKPLSIEADYKIDCKEKLVLPGLINTHTHIPMTLLRGYGDDMILNKWLEERERIADEYREECLESPIQRHAFSLDGHRLCGISCFDRSMPPLFSQKRR